jgi:hypothetical protein
MKHKNSPSAACLLLPLAHQPWWVGVALALATYVVLEQLAELPTSALAQGVINVVAVLVPLLCLVCAARSAWRQRMAALAWQSTMASDGAALPHAAPAQPDFEDTVPPCPVCNSGMVRRTARGGADDGKELWRCVNHPVCEGWREVE